LIVGAGGVVPEVPAATQRPNDQISEVRFETVDFSGCLSNFVSKIDTPAGAFLTLRDSSGRAIRQLQELTSEGHAEGVVDLRSPGWSEAQPWVLNVNRRPALKDFLSVCKGKSRELLTFF